MTEPTDRDQATRDRLAEVVAVCPEEGAATCRASAGECCMEPQPLFVRCSGSPPPATNPVDELVCRVVQALWDTDRAQTVIADDLGISQKHLSMIRQGRAEPSLGLLRRMCTVLRIPVVAELVREGQAEALETFAEKWQRWIFEDALQTRGGAAYRARAEAAALRAPRPGATS